jgi:hypothetical protein
MIEISDSDMRTIARQLPHIRDKTLRGINALRIIVLILWKLVRKYEKQLKEKNI